MMPLARIARGRHDVAVVVGQRLIGARSGQDAPGGHELKVVQQPAEALRPFLLKVWRHLGGSDAFGDAIHHLPRIGLQRLIDVFEIARHDLAVEQFNRHLRQRQLRDRADLALSGRGIDDDDHRIANRQGTARHILLGVAIQKDFVSQVMKLISFPSLGLNHRNLSFQSVAMFKSKPTRAEKISRCGNSTSLCSICAQLSGLGWTHGRLINGVWNNRCSSSLEALSVKRTLA